MAEQVGARQLQPAPASAPLPAAPSPRPHPLAPDTSLTALQRLRLVNALALGEVAESAKNAVLHPGKAIADTVKGLGQMATQPGVMLDAARRTWAQDRKEGTILTGRLAAGYIGMAGMALGGAALLGRLGANAARLPNLSFAMQKAGQVLFRTAGIAGTAAIGIDAAAMAAHEVDAARAATTQDLKQAAEHLHADMSNLAANAAMAGVSKVGGAGMKVLGRHLREQELARSLAATNKAVNTARQAETTLSASQMSRIKYSGVNGGADASLVEELSTLVGRKVKHLSAADRVKLAEYLNESLSQVEQAASGKAIAEKLQSGAPIGDLLQAGELAAWEVSGVSRQALQGLIGKGWDATSLQRVRELIRATGIREGQQPAALRAAVERLLQAEDRTSKNTFSLQKMVTRHASLDSLTELGVTRNLDGVSISNLQHLDEIFHSADPRTRQRLVGLLNDGKGKVDVPQFWLKAYERLYADLGVDPAIYRALAPSEVTMTGLTALEKVYSQLKQLPAESRARVSKAVAALELKPGDARLVMQQAHIQEMAASIEQCLPAAEKGKAGTIAAALVQEVLEGQSVRTRSVLSEGVKDLPGQLLRGNVKAIPAFARAVGKSKAQTDNVLAGVSAAVSKLPETTRRQIFSKLHPDRPVGSQVTHRLTKVLTDDFGIRVKRSQTSPQPHWELTVADMDAAGALHLYNALESMSGPAKNLPPRAKAGIYTRSATHDFGGVALDGDDGHKYTVLTDGALVEDSWSEPAGTPHAEGIWIHETGHQMQATGTTAAERARIAEWAQLGDWKHATGKVADGTHPYKRTDHDIYKDPTVGGNTRESVNGYAKTDPAEDWAEFVRIGTSDPVAALALSPPKFLYFAAQMASGWADKLPKWANAAGVDLLAAQAEAARRLGPHHPAMAKINALLAGLSH